MRDKSHSHVGVVSLCTVCPKVTTMCLCCGQLLLALLPLLSWSVAASVERTVQCLKHDQQNEIFLDCGPDRLIHILQAQHGHVAPQNTSNCTYQEGDECGVAMPNMEYLRDHCMGRHQCTAGVSPLFLDPCGRESNYVQVLYDCISDQGTMMDVCGDNTEEKKVTRTSGYINSLNYPRPYSPDNTCSCLLTTPSLDSHITLTLLDLHLSSAANDDWSSDWLEYSSNRKDWGSGRVLRLASPNRTVHTGSQIVYLNFRSDHQREARGFWLQYQGLTSDGAQVPVNVRCHIYIPPSYKHSMVCFSNSKPQELFLSCRSQGVINVLHARQGWRGDINTSSCVRPDDISGDTCVMHMQGDELMDTCSGRQECNVQVERASLPSCPHNSSYLLTEYQCIEDRKETGNIVDVCGEQTAGATLEREMGYIKSMNYPQSYSPDTNCSCWLQTAQSDATIILTILDIKLHSAPSCDRDWLKYRSSTQIWGEGVNLCSQTVREKLFTTRNLMHLDFYADSKSEERGFWVKYEGRRPDGFKATVKLRCLPSSGRPGAGSHGPGDTATDLPSTSTETVTQDTSNSKHANAGVAVGLVTSICLIFVIAGIVIFCKHRKAQSSKLPAMSSTSSYGAAADNTFSVLTKRASRTYSTLHDPQTQSAESEPRVTTFGNQPRVTIENASQAANDDEVVSYLKPPPKVKTTAAPSYMNPAYTGTTDDAADGRYYTINI